MLYSQIVLIGRGILNQASLHIGQRLRQYQAHATRVTMTHHVQGSQMLWSFVLCAANFKSSENAERTRCNADEGGWSKARAESIELDRGHRDYSTWLDGQIAAAAIIVGATVAPCYRTASNLCIYCALHLRVDAPALRGRK